MTAQPQKLYNSSLCSVLLYLIRVLLYVCTGALGLPMRGMSNNTPQLNRSLSQGTQLPNHVTPTTGVPTMSLHTPPSPSRYSVIWFCPMIRAYSYYSSSFLCILKFQNMYVSELLFPHYHYHLLLTEF